MSPTFLFVHLFSGRRRTGDFHMELQNFALQKNWRVVILSLDTAVSIEYGATSFTTQCHGRALGRMLPLLEELRRPFVGRRV